MRKSIRPAENPLRTTRISAGASGGVCAAADTHNTTAKKKGLINNDRRCAGWERGEDTSNFVSAGGPSRCDNLEL